MWVCDDNDGGDREDSEDSEDSGDSDDGDDGDDDYDTKFWQIEDGSVGSPSAAQDPAFPPDWNPFWSPAATIFLPQNCWWRFSAVFLAILLLVQAEEGFFGFDWSEIGDHISDLNPLNENGTGIGVII